MPVRESIPHEWYNTPNIHFCTIKDFKNLCNKMNIAIENKTYLNRKNNIIYSMVERYFANFFAEYGIFLITKDLAPQNCSEIKIENKKIVTRFGLSPSFVAKDNL